MTYVVPEELKRMLDDADREDPRDATVLARILERHAELVRDQVQREQAPSAPFAPAFGHEIRFFLHPCPNQARTHYFGATCSCGNWNSGLNAIKWVLLGIQQHITEYGLAWEVGNLVDDAVLEQNYDNARRRLDLARHALVADGYFAPEQVDDDIAPRITELAAYLRRQLDQGLPGALLEALDQLRGQVRLLERPAVGNA